MPTEIKICGINAAEPLEAAISGGARYVGFVHFPASPRHVDFPVAQELFDQARGRIHTVLLTVDPDDALLETIVDTLKPDFLQLHGLETPERVDDIARMTQSRIIKAMGVESAAEVRAARHYKAADWILLDAKPSSTDTRPGGLGRSFDWNILKGIDAPRPFMLSGGLTHENVGKAIDLVRPTGVDVSSGVESQKGVKDIGLIAKFIEAVSRADEIAV